MGPATENLHNNGRQRLWPGPQHRNDHGRATSSLIKPVKMMDRSVTVTDGEAISGRDGGAEPGLGMAHRRFHVLALGKAGRDRRGQRASGAVGIWRSDA